MDSQSHGKFKKIEEAISFYDKNSLLPELDTAVELANALSQTAELEGASKWAKGKLAETLTESIKETSVEIKHHLLQTEITLKEGLSDLKLANDFVLFLDGLDARPNDIEKVEFDNCLQGLYDAVWQLNTDFFPHIRDSRGKLRICLLVRPDIFELLNAHNSNSRLSDNSVILNWDTTESEYKNSTLFEVVNNYFLNQNDKTSEGWDRYFPYSENGKNRFFVDLMKMTYLRPRDYFTAIKILIQKASKERSTSETFDYKNDCRSAFFFREFSDYLIGEVKNYLNFYISNKDYAEYINFFQFLNGRSNFSWQEFLGCFEKFKKHMDLSEIDNRKFYATPNALLPLFFDTNMIGYVEYPADGSKPFIRWSYRERTNNQLYPKVKPESNYVVFEGFMKALDLGKAYT